MPAELRLSPGDANHLINRAQAGSGVTQLTIGDLVRIDTAKALAAVRQRLCLYGRAKDLIVRDPEIIGGAPTLKGTRITAQSILGPIQDGDSVATIIEDYPYLDREAVEAAAPYAEANPLRGRHPGLAILRDAGGQMQQLVLGAVLAHAIEAAGSAQGGV